MEVHRRAQFNHFPWMWTHPPPHTPIPKGWMKTDKCTSGNRKNIERKYSHSNTKNQVGNSRSISYVTIINFSSNVLLGRTHIFCQPGFDMHNWFITPPLLGCHTLFCMVVHVGIFAHLQPTKCWHNYKIYHVHNYVHIWSSLCMCT